MVRSESKSGIRLGHIGVSVRNLENSIRFYEQALNSKTVFGPTQPVVAHKSRMGTLCANKLGPHFKSLRLAVLQIDTHHALELFEFPDAKEKEVLEYGQFLFNPGHFLFSFHCDDLELSLKKILDAGGNVKSEILKLWDTKDWYIVYCTDIDGNTFELTSHSFTDMWFEK